MTSHELADDSIYEILSYLPCSALIHSASLVSKQWNVIARNISLDVKLYNWRMIDYFVNLYDDDGDEENNLKIKSVSAHYLESEGFRELMNLKKLENVEILDFSYLKFNEIEKGEELEKIEKLKGSVWNFPNLKKLILNNVVLGEKLGKSIGNSPSLGNLQVLELSHVGLVRFQIESICVCETLKKLTFLNISKNNLEEDGCELLLKSSFSNSLTSLNMGSCGVEYNQFTQGISQYFRRILFTFPKLTNLNYSRNILGDSDLVKVESLGNLTSLDISCNPINEKSASFFQKPIFNKMKHLKFSNGASDCYLYSILLNNPTANNISSIDLVSSTELLTNLFNGTENLTNFTTLTILDFSAINHFILRKPCFENLSTLVLEGCFFDDPEFLDLSNCKFLTSLTYLSLSSFIDIDFKVFDRISSQLSVITLSDCSLNFNTLISCDVMNNITELSIHSCNITEDNVRQLAECGKTGQLAKLNLSDRTIENVDSLFDHYEHFKNLQLLSLSCDIPKDKLSRFPKLTKVQYLSDRSFSMMSHNNYTIHRELLK